MNSVRHTHVAATLLVALLAGCNQAPPPATEAPRPVKVEVLSSSAAQASESFVGTLRARQRADLSFEQAGRVASIAVDVGDRVRAGQLLARLDEAPVQWRLDKALADRSAALATLAERSTQLRQHEALAKDQIVSATTLETVQTQHQLATSQLQAAEAALAQARHDLAHTRITAPFDGEIVTRTVQPHVDMAAGQPVLQIEAGQALEVVAMLPDGVAARLAPGQVANALLSSEQGSRSLPLKLERLSAHSESGSLVQAVFRIVGAATGARSGGVVSVELPRSTAPTLSLPVQAVLPGATPGQASVFVLNASQGRLVRRGVQLGEGLLPNGRLPVRAGLSAGEQVVVAGAAFLTDGQAAIRHESQTVLQGASQ